LAPRLIVKLPAMGNRSIRAARTGTLLEVILNSGEI
jgi:hypothetical protein